VLNRKADSIQKEFITLSERIDELGRLLLEAEGEERQRLREEQKAIREEQQGLAEEINIWRDRARSVTSQPGTASLRNLLNELLELEEEMIKPAIEHAIYLLDAPEDELAALDTRQEPVQMTSVQRLLERARIEYDLRGSDTAVRLREAIAFANRPGMAQDDEALAEIEAAMQDSDPLVREIAILTTAQLHRFRAIRVADLDVVHESVQYLSRMTHPSVVPILIEILENPRTGFVIEEGESVESNNDRSRMVALLRLVEWHTADAKAAIQARQFDRDEHIVKASDRALELFPGPWSGPLKGTGSLEKGS
jgi:HEAT repeat protein